FFCVFRMLCLCIAVMEAKSFGKTEITLVGKAIRKGFPVIQIGFQHLLDECLVADVVMQAKGPQSDAQHSIVADKLLGCAGGLQPFTEMAGLALYDRIPGKDFFLTFFHTLQNFPARDAAKSKWYGSVHCCLAAKRRA